MKQTSVFALYQPEVSVWRQYTDLHLDLDNLSHGPMLPSTSCQHPAQLCHMPPATVSPEAGQQCKVWSRDDSSQTFVTSWMASVHRRSMHRVAACTVMPVRSTTLATGWLHWLIGGHRQVPTACLVLALACVLLDCGACLFQISYLHALRGATCVPAAVLLARPHLDGKNGQRQLRWATKRGICNRAPCRTLENI